MRIGLTYAYGSRQYQALLTRTVPDRTRTYFDCCWLESVPHVTECICTLCLCCCTLYVTLSSVSVSSFFFYCVWGRIMTSLINNSFTYVLRIIIWGTTERAREKARGNNNGLSHVPSKRKEEIIRNLWLWLVCCSLLPTCNFS